jgi:tetratricopeptide (TPR) repeat protein
LRPYLLVGLGLLAIAALTALASLSIGGGWLGGRAVMSGMASIPGILLAMAQVAALLLMLALMVVIVRWIVVEDTSLRIQPFDNATGNENLRGVRELLMAEMQRIDRIHDADRDGLRAAGLPLALRPVDVGKRLDPARWTSYLSQAMITAKRQRLYDQTLVRPPQPERDFTKIGNVQYGGATISVGEVLRTLKDLWPFTKSAPVLSGSIQRYGKQTRLVLWLIHGGETTWWYASRATESDAAIPGMVSELAFELMRDEVDSYLCMARNWLSFKHYTDGLECYASYVAAGRDVDLYRCTGHAEKAVELEPQYQELFVLFYRLGNVYLDRKEYVAADNMYDRAVGLLPDADAMNSKGVALEGLRRPQDAAKCYQRAIEIDPKFALAYSNLSRYWTSISRVDKADSTLNDGLQRAAENDPFYAHILADRSGLLGRSGRFGEALRIARDAVNLQSELPFPYAQAGFAAFDLEDYQGARQYFERAIQLYPGDVMSRLYLSFALVRQDSVDAALNYLIGIADLNESSAEIFDQLGRGYALLGRYTDAIDAKLRGLALTSPSPATLHISLAGYCRKLGNSNAWKEHIAEATKQKDQLSAYDLACLASVAEQRDDALTRVVPILANGGISPGHVCTDPDLDYISTDVRFQEALTAARWRAISM